MRQQSQCFECFLRETFLSKQFERIHISVIFDHIMKESRANCIFVVHLDGQIKRMQYIRIAALIYIEIVRVVSDVARFSNQIGIYHNFCARRPVTLVMGH